MSKFHILILVILAALAYSAYHNRDGRTEPPRQVVATLPPIHSLLAGVMKGVEDPVLLLDGPESPHSVNLTPSDISQLKQAGMVVVTGLNAESYLKPVLEALGEDKPLVIETLNIPGLTLFPMVEGEGHAKKNTTPEPDMHIWLDPLNAVAMTQYFAQELSEHMPDHASTFRDNAKDQIRKLNALNKSIQDQFTKYGTPRTAAYVTYHPFMQYYEKRYAIAANKPTAKTPDAGVKPSEAERVHQLAKEHKLSCLLTEPQFSPRMLETVSEDYDIPIKQVDPLGTTLTDGDTLYFTLMENLTETVLGCLAYLPPQDAKKVAP